MPRKITPLYFFYHKPLYFAQKEPIEVNLSHFWVLGWKIAKYIMSYLKLQVSFSSKFPSLFSVMRNDSSVLFFRWNCTWFRQIEPIKVQDFRLLTAFVESIYNFLLKKYRGVMSHYPEDWYKVWRKTDLLFKKWQEFGEFWSEHLKV